MHSQSQTLRVPMGVMGRETSDGIWKGSHLAEPRLPGAHPSSDFPYRTPVPDQGQFSAGAQTRSTDCLVSDININSKRGHRRGDPEARVHKLGIFVRRDFRKQRETAVATTAEADIVFCVPCWSPRFCRPSDCRVSVGVWSVQGLRGDPQTIRSGLLKTPLEENMMARIQRRCLISPRPHSLLQNF